MHRCRARRSVSPSWQLWLDMLSIVILIDTYFRIPGGRRRVRQRHNLRNAEIDLIDAHAQTKSQETRASIGDGSSESGLPDPDPLFEFDLETATARNHLYVNKAMRYPYFQVRIYSLYVASWS